ncbi:hypothetical protein D3C81_1964190 [compost metagenome]
MLAQQANQIEPVQLTIVQLVVEYQQVDFDLAQSSEQLRAAPVHAHDTELGFARQPRFHRQTYERVIIKDGNA